METAARTVTPEDLDRLVRFVVETVKPLRIVLLGSAAKGEMTKDSDIDLLVVMPDGTDRRAVGMRLYEQRSRQALPIGHPVDFVVTTEEVVERRKDSFGLIYFDVERDGRELYAA